MADVDVSVSSELSPAQAWTLAANLDRFDEWLTIFGGWKSPVPDVVAKGATVSSLIKVKGFRNVIHWEVTGFDVLRRIELRGRRRAGRVGSRVRRSSIRGEPRGAADRSHGVNRVVVRDATGGSGTLTR
jgi:hypothetical protein